MLIKKFLLYLMYTIMFLAGCAGDGDDPPFRPGSGNDDEDEDEEHADAAADASDDADTGADADADTDTDIDTDTDTDSDTDTDADAECSGNGEIWTWGSVSVCACDEGYSPGSAAGDDCVPSDQVVVAGAIDYDVDGDGLNETWFEPSDIEIEMFELVNYTRATHDDEGSPECHTPLMYNLIWSAHGRNHSKKMFEADELFHEDYPRGQNCAYGCGPACEMDMYMNGPDEPHCPELSHHCNIMNCNYDEIGIGYWNPDTGTWNTQNFL